MRKNYFGKWQSEKAKNITSKMRGRKKEFSKCFQKHKQKTNFGDFFYGCENIDKVIDGLMEFSQFYRLVDHDMMKENFTKMSYKFQLHKKVIIIIMIIILSAVVLFCKLICLQNKNVYRI